MKIRKEQIDHVITHDEEKFISDIIEHLHEESYDLIENIPKDSLRDMVANGLRRARSHGFRAAGDLMAFVSVMFEIAPNFDEHPEIRKVLRDESIPLDERFDALFERVSDKGWEEADGNYDEYAWYPGLKKDIEELYPGIHSKKKEND